MDNDCFDLRQNLFFPHYFLFRERNETFNNNCLPFDSIKVQFTLLVSVSCIEQLVSDDNNDATLKKKTYGKNDDSDLIDVH